MNLFYCCCNTMAPNTRVTRKWELFAGRNKFYCDGILMSAPHTGVFYLTCFLITGTSALFFAFDCPYLATRITPAIPIVGVVLYFFTMSSLLRTTFTDPGVIPRASHDEAAYIEKQIEVPNSLNSPTYRPPPRTKEVLVKGQTVKLKYCFTCKIFRPPRASHCSLCDNCVDRFDHHCPWVGNCVGKRNYRFFYMFLVSLAFLAVFIFSCSVTHLVLLMKMEQEVFEVIKKAPFSVVVTFICFFSIWSVIGLAGFHTYLTTSDQTTNEDLKGSFSSKGGQRAVNPYSRGNICLNCVHILCGPMTPSLIDRRGIVTDEYISQMQHNSQNPTNQLLTDLTSAPSPLITNQPSVAGIEPSVSGKHRMFDDNNPGIYRHRSYDNLQNGNSNSLARLVDNEAPLSQRDGPTVGVAIPQQQQQQHYQQQQQYHQQQQQISPTITDDDTLENNILLNRQTRLNNLSGSYNNLFRDNIDSLLFYGSNNNNNNNSTLNNTNDDIINCLNDDYDKDNLSISDDYKMINDRSFQSSSSILLAATASLPTSVTALAAHSLCHPMKFSHEFSSNLMMNTSGTRDSNNINCGGGGGIGRHHRTLMNNLRKSASESENVYSNIPNSNISSSAASSNGSNKSDPNLHVYSNLIEEHQHQQEQQQQQQQQSQNQQLQKQKQHQLRKQKHKQQSQNNLLNTNNKQLSLSLSKLHDRNNEDNLFTTKTTTKQNKSDVTNIVAPTSTTTKDTLKQNLETIPSTLFTNDLDLDDPVSAFVVNNSKKFELSSNRKMKNRKGVITSSSSSEQQQHSVDKHDMEMKSDNSMTISNSQTLVVSPNQSSTAANTVGNNGKERDSAGTGAAATSFITPSRLRLLQDTTMINTALDLDSLDGSSIGNNSQSCLIKTAMV